MVGLYFEDLVLGRTFAHEPGRTVTETDNLLFTTLTLNPQPLHLDAEFARESIHGQILVNSIFTLGLVVGLSVGDTTLGTPRQPRFRQDDVPTGVHRRHQPRRLPV